MFSVLPRLFTIITRVLKIDGSVHFVSILLTASPVIKMSGASWVRVSEEVFQWNILPAEYEHSYIRFLVFQITMRVSKMTFM